MKIESVDFFYLSMPEVMDIGDGSQDALLVRVRAGGLEGWGECEASPLTSIASYVCPMSHSACHDVKFSVEGKRIESVEDIRKISVAVHENSFDLLQADHTLSGIDIALWDLLGKKVGAPVYSLLGYKKAYPKMPYASQLFGNTPYETFQKAKNAIASGFRAVKFGWGSFGKENEATDRAHLMAAREGVGKETHLMIDAGTIWKTDVVAAKKRISDLKSINAFWLEEPFTNLALGAYKCIARIRNGIPLAGGEGCNNFVQAQSMIQYAGIKFVQIDAGRIGGITIAKQVADLAVENKVSYVNHSFTSHLALSASLQPYAGIEKDSICEYPFEPQTLAKEIAQTKLLRDSNGHIHIPEKPGLGIDIDIKALKKYLVAVEIKIKGKTVYRTPEV
jgi:L-alanine-DL-glutamate epimerase-like enolase superfamily enzyme